MTTIDKPAPVIGVGSPGILLLEGWAYQLWLAFDEVAYLVGTAAQGKKWRDVDVRVMLDDDAFTALIGRMETPMHFNHRWAALCTALSVWGRQQTGLPIDFQFQTRTQANDLFRDQVRIPLIAGAPRSEPCSLST
jgi:hypothetical protein